MKTSFRLLLMFAFAINASLYSQDSEKAKAYFEKYKNSDGITALIAKSLPSKEDCDQVFTPENSDIYYTYIEGIRNNKPSAEGQKLKETYVDLSIETFTTEDVQVKKGNYAGGMNSIADKLKPGIVFYKLEMLRKTGAEYGMAYKYWVKIKDRWVFFPKPWHAFATNPK